MCLLHRDQHNSQSVGITTNLPPFAFTSKILYLLSTAWPAAIETTVRVLCNLAIRLWNWLRATRRRRVGFAFWLHRHIHPALWSFFNPWLRAIWIVRRRQRWSRITRWILMLIVLVRLRHRVKGALRIDHIRLRIVHLVHVIQRRIREGVLGWHGSRIICYSLGRWQWTLNRVGVDVFPSGGLNKSRVFA